MKRSLSVFILLLLTLIIGERCYAQLIFPNGKEKKFSTTLSVVYDETKIPFIYRNGKVTTLSWKRLSDSIPADWFIMACMNGTCLGGVPESGKFDNFTALPDSVGFLKYHFDFKDIPGTAKIRFLIFNELLFGADADTATFTITHVTNNVVGNEDQKFRVTVYPNPSSGYWSITGVCDEPILSYVLTDISGRQVPCSVAEIHQDRFSMQINNVNMSSGIYFLDIQTQNYRQRIQLVRD